MTISRELEGKVAIVTGAGSGIGRAIATRFAGAGARVVLVDIANESIDEVAQTIANEGAEAVAVHCDVTKQSDVVEHFQRVVERFGALDVLVNSAGVAHVGNIEQTNEAEFDRLYAVNVKGVYNCLKAAVPAMKGRGGAILNIASVASTVGIPDRFAYSMTKGAVLTMTYSVARDYVEHNIRCNCLAPGRIHTPFVDGFLARSYPGREREMFDQLALFLCSDRAAFITGSNYAIDGGFVMLKM